MWRHTGGVVGFLTTKLLPVQTTTECTIKKSIKLLNIRPNFGQEG